MNFPSPSTLNMWALSYRFNRSGNCQVPRKTEKYFGKALDPWVDFISRLLVCGKSLSWPRPRFRPPDESFNWAQKIHFATWNGMGKL